MPQRAFLSLGRFAGNDKFIGIWKILEKPLCFVFPEAFIGLFGMTGREWFI